MAADQFSLTLPNLGANANSAAEDFNRLNTLLGTLTPSARAMWLSDPVKLNEFNTLAAAAGREPYSETAYQWITPAAKPPTILTPNQPPPGGWTDQNTYDDIFGPKPPTPPAPPQRPGTVPGSVWNNPESEAPRGYNPELWAQREIGPNRTYQGGITGLGIGGPTNADGTAMYTAPAEIKPTREIDPFGYDPANLFQREKFEGQFSGGPDVLSNAQGDSFERNLLSSIAEAINSTDPAVSERAKFIMAAASNPAILRDMPFRRNGPANLIDRAGYQYDMQNGGDRRRQSQSTDTGKDSMDREKKNPFMPRMAKGTMPMRAPMRMPIVEYQQPPPGPMGMNPFVPSFADPTRRMPVHTMPSERVPTPMQRGPAVPGRLPIQLGPVAGPLTIGSRPVVAPAPNPFLGGGASRGYRNPFR